MEAVQHGRPPVYESHSNCQRGSECACWEGMGDVLKLEPVPRELVKRLYTHHFGMFPTRLNMVLT